MSRQLTRRQFVSAAGASAIAALLEACRTPGPLDPTAAPQVGPTRYSAYLPYIEKGATPTPEPPPPPPPPTPTPRPRRVFPSFERPSKLGIAVQRFNDPQIVDRIVADGRPRVVKIWDDLGAAAQIKQLSPGTIVVGHIHQEYDFQNAITSGATDMSAYAADFVARHLSKYQSNTGVDYWEGHNEPVFEVEWKMAMYGQFEAERVRHMAAYGLKCAVGNFSSGSPSLEQWDDFLPALQAVKQRGGVLALHEYAAPTMQHGYDPASGEGWLTLRYRKVYRNFVPPSLHVPIIMTECGVDGLVGADRPGPPGAGWKEFIDYWRTQPVDPDPLLAYLDQLQWYDEELQKDELVIGAAIFLAGALSGFETYDITGEMGELFTQYLMAHPAAG
jgi:hypothetical protein